MQKYFFLFFFILFFVTESSAQKASEWWTQGKYIKIPVTQKGVYQLAVENLKTIWPDLNQQPKVSNFELFRHGKKVNIFDVNGRIEFYGEPNDGKPDTELYLKPAHQANTFTNFYSDTAYYYLRCDYKINESTASQSLQVAGAEQIKYHLEHDRKIFATSWTFNPRTGPIPGIESPYMDLGEGFSGPMLQKNVLNVLQISLEDFDESVNIAPKINIQLNGRDDFPHKIELKIGIDTLQQQAIQDLEFGQASYFNHSFEIPKNLTQNKNLLLTTKSVGLGQFDRYSVNYQEVIYPKTLKNIIAKNTNFWFPASKKGLKPNFNLSNTQTAYLIDNEDTKRLASQQIELPANNQETIIFVGTPTEITKFETVQFDSFDKIQANYVIITHPTFNQAAEGFAKYRNSVEGGKYEANIFNIRKLYDQFSYGIRSPMAIRNFLTKLATENPKERFVLLIGQGTSIFDVKFWPNPGQTDIVPTWGFPGSDNALSAGINGASPFEARYPTGRISTTSPTVVLDYLAKVIENEKSVTDNLWRKRILHLSGGRSVGELQYFKEILASFLPSVNAGALAARVEAVTKQTIDPVEKITVSKQVNDGVGLLTFFGHSSPAGADIDMGVPADAARGFQNKGKYPIMFLNGCGLGNAFYGATPFASQWVNAKDKGAILAISHTAAGYTFPLSVYMKNFYEVFNNQAFVNQPFGLVQQETVRRVSRAFKDDLNNSNSLLMCLQGDPAVRFYQSQQPDYELKPEQIFVQSGSIESISKRDSIQLGVIVTNAGKFVQANKPKIKISINGIDYQQVVKEIAFRDTLFFNIKKSVGNLQAKVQVDASNEIIELNEQNNEATFTADLTSIGNATLFPENIIPDRVRPRVVVKVRQQNILLNNQTLVVNTPLAINLQDDRKLNQVKNELQIVVKDCAECDFKAIGEGLNWTYDSDKTLTLQIGGILTKKGEYTIQIQGFDASRNKAFDEPIEYKINVVDQPTENTALAFPNPAVGYLKVSTNLKTEQKVVIKIIDLTGNQVYLGNNQGFVGINEWVLDLDEISFNNGVHLVQIEGNDGLIISEKVILIK